ncbi:hypothetical protein, partial [Nostoc edaphicum]|uniref:hypothetical protein n=1 Tax=Nostoc edaphicum TaxID=264686 RepID=UPI001D156C60
MTCNANASTCNANASTCYANASTCYANASTCYANASTCYANASTCYANAIGFGYNTVQLRLKLFVKVNFFNVDAKRLAEGYRRGAEETERREKML